MTRVLVLAPDLARNSVYPPWQFAQALEAGGHSVTLAGPSSGAPWAPLGDDLADALALPGRWAGWPRARDAIEVGADARVVLAFKAMPTSLGVGLKVRSTRRIPLLLHLDDWDAGFFDGVSTIRRAWYGIRGLTNPVGDLWLRYMETRVSQADALSVSTRALQRRFGGTVIRQGVDTHRYSPQRFPHEEARQRVGATAGQPMILFLGTPRRHKGLRMLGEGVRVKRWIWFVGASREDLVAASVPPAVVSDAVIRPSVPFDEAAWYLSASDVFVVPQSQTPFAEHQLPAKLLQAMALGCTIVATDVGDAAELLGGTPQAGLLVPPDDPGGLQAALTRLLDDPMLRSRLGQEARRRAEAGLGWDAMRSQVETLMSRVGVDG